MQRLTEKSEIENFLKQDLPLNVYSIGDLDDFFWPQSIYFGQYIDGKLQAVILLYQGGSLPTLLAICKKTEAMSNLLGAMVSVLPDEFYSHLSPGLEKVLEDSFSSEYHGLHNHMYLETLKVKNSARLNEVVQLSSDDLQVIEELYSRSYPGNWFDARMLATNRYYGIFAGNQLASVAGIHVYSTLYKAAALGNITTDSKFRGQGFGNLVTTKLCQVLKNEGLSIGLNVKADNQSAISCYQQIGFRMAGEYNEYHFKRKNPK